MKKIVTNYFSLPLDTLDDNFEQRVFLYLAYGLLVGSATFLSLVILGIIRGYPVIQAFQGMYSWHTTLNFGLCFVLVIKAFRFLQSRGEDQQNWRVSHLWLLGVTSFCIAYLFQRTLVYAGVQQYNPELIEYYNRFPDARPSFAFMLGWCLFFWIPTFTVLVQIAIWKQKKYMQFCRGANAPETRRWSLDGGKTLLNIDDITHISMADHYALVCWQKDGESQEKLVRLSMKEAIKQLPADRFIQIHRSHLINIGYAEGLYRQKQKWMVRIGESELPVSRSRLADIKSRVSGES